MARMFVEDVDDSSDLDALDDEFSLVLNSQKKHISKPRHPSADRINQLWEVFVENVDPLTKVVHVPTLKPAIQKATKNVMSIPRSLETLMFAIYSCAVMSVRDEECEQRFSEPAQDPTFAIHLCHGGRIVTSQIHGDD